MAKAKIETNNQYLDSNPQDFSQEVQDALAEERLAYEVLKEARAKVKALVVAELDMPDGLEVKYTTFTRWGQWQVVVGDIVAPKSTAKPRQSLADYLATRQ